MVSWRALALHFANRGEACALLDRDARIQMFSSSFESLLAKTREDVEGKSWFDVLTPASHVAVAKGRIDRALSGTLRHFELEAVGPSNTRFSLNVESSLVGRDDEQGLLLAVRSADIIGASPDRGDLDIDYEIVPSITDFGRLLSLRAGSGCSTRVVKAGDRCFAVIHGHASPCEDCPALHPADGAWPRTVARRRPGPGEEYEVVTANVRDERVLVRLRRVSEQTLGAIHESKLRSLADSAQLSDRERDVLTYLLMGRALSDIAAILGISIRTVKFHQANILEKVGADSRADLIRIIT